MNSARKMVRRRRSECSLSLEALEDRCLLSASVVQTNLVSDIPGVANVTDANLVNPWGISASPTGPFWISEAGASVPYSAPGKPQALVVSIPTPGNPAGAANAPTGTVFNIAYGSRGFMISDGTRSAPATFLFATTDGTIAAWNPKVDPSGRQFGLSGSSTRAVIAVDYSSASGSPYQADYRGLTIGTDTDGQTYLYAANARSGRIDVFDSSFQRADLPSGAFMDPSLPKTYTPSNVQVLGDQVYVTYAKRYYTSFEPATFPGNGFVDVFNMDGSGGRRLVSRGPLNAPWGMAIAPASFGALAGGLMVGNFGNGRINVFDPQTGACLGTVNDASGNPIQIDGLWALKVGNGYAGGDANTVYFTAGLDDKHHGLFGALTAAAPASSDLSSQMQSASAQTSQPPQAQNQQVQSQPAQTQQAQGQQAPNSGDQSAAAAACDTPNMTPGGSASNTSTNEGAAAPAPSAADTSTLVTSDAPAASGTAADAAAASAGAASDVAATVAAPYPLHLTVPSWRRPGILLPADPSTTSAVASDSAYPADSYTTPAPLDKTSQTHWYESSFQVTVLLVPLGSGKGYYQYDASEGDADSTPESSATTKAQTTKVAEGGAVRVADRVMQPVSPPAAFAALIATVAPLLLRGESGTPAPEDSAHAPLSVLDLPRERAIDLEAVAALVRGSVTQLETLLEAPADELVGVASISQETFSASARRGGLAGGALTMDLASLRGAVDKFFARLESLADDLVGLPHAQLLAQWLLAGAAATGMFEFIRRGSKPERGADEEGEDESSWAPFPMLALAPPEDQP